MFGKLKAGDRPTFLEAPFANRVLGFLDAIMTAKVIPAGAGKLTASETSVVLDLSALQSANQAAQIALLTKQLADAQSQLTAINKALRSATIASTAAAACDPATSAITVTVTTRLTIPGLP